MTHISDNWEKGVVEFMLCAIYAVTGDMCCCSYQMWTSIFQAVGGINVR
jgi:hypothetical protein